MPWFNYYGLIIVVLLLLPNLIYFFTHKAITTVNKTSKAIEIFEQIGRYACMLFMIFNIPYTYFNFWFNKGLLAYLILNGVLYLCYIIFWLVFLKKDCLAKALMLSITPSLIFLVSGIILANIPLIAFAILFAGCHIYISAHNVKKTNTSLCKTEV